MIILEDLTTCVHSELVLWINLGIHSPEGSNLATLIPLSALQSSACFLGSSAQGRYLVSLHLPHSLPCIFIICLMESVDFLTHPLILDRLRINASK